MKPFFIQTQLNLFARTAHALPVIGFAQAQRVTNLIGIAFQQLFHAKHAGGFGRELVHANIHHAEKLMGLQFFYRCLPRGGAMPSAQCPR